MNQEEAHRSRVEPGREAAEGAGMLGQIDPKEVVGMVSSFARENPHAALAGACVIGFLLGGGLSPRLLGGLAMIAGRKYLNTTLRETMQAAMQGALREQLGVR